VNKPGDRAVTIDSILVGWVYDVDKRKKGQYLLYSKDSEGDEEFQFWTFGRANSLIADGTSRSAEPSPTFP